MPRRSDDLPRHDGALPTAVGPFGFDSALHRYTDRTGRVIPWTGVRSVYDRVIDVASDRIRSHVAALRSGTGDLDTFRAQMAREIKTLHVQAVALARGGWAEMRQSDFGRAGRAIRDEYAYLDRFVADIASGRQRLDGTLAVRATMYADAARGSFHRALLAAMQTRGATEERNVLGRADHCAGCVAETKRQWVPIGTLVPIGRRTCLSRCRCHVQYRDADGNVLD